MQVAENCVNAEWATWLCELCAGTREGSAAESFTVCHVYWGPALSEFHEVAHCGDSDKKWFDIEPNM
jgi:hypothetical protein